MITLELHNSFGIINGNIDEKHLKELDNILSYQIQGYQFMQYAGSTWDGRKRLLNKKNGKYPIGLTSKIEEFLTKRAIAYQIVDRRILPAPRDYLDFSASNIFEDREYQAKVIETAIQNGSGIVRACTGSGKTSMVSKLIGHYKVKTIVYVISVSLLYQFKETLERLYPFLKVGVIGDGKCQIEDVTVATIQSIGSAFNYKLDLVGLDSEFNKEKVIQKVSEKEAIKKAVQDTELFIFDECHIVGSALSLLAHNNSFNARHRFLFSATPWRSSGDSILIEAVGGPEIAYVSAEELIKLGYLVPPKILFMRPEPKKRIGNTYPEVYKNYIVENEQRNDMILKAALHFQEQGRKTITMVSKLNHAKILREIYKDKVNFAYIDGKTSVSDRIDAMKALANGEISNLIGSQILNIGIDIPLADAAIMAGPVKSDIVTLQRIGRLIRRPHELKKDALIIDFYDQAKYLKDHALARLNTYRNEKGFKIKF